MTRFLPAVSIFCAFALANAYSFQAQAQSPALEPWTYSENFEDRELGAWASYPHWQDIAYNQDFRPNEMVPGDPNISVVQKVTAYTNVDAYAGAQKLLDMYLVPDARLSFRYFLKSNTPAESYKVLFAAGDRGKLELTINNPERNKWVSTSISFQDLVRQNPGISGLASVRIHALAFLAKFPMADPAMPIYFGIDDINFTAARQTAFRFQAPEVHKLPEYAQYIPKKHYFPGDEFVLRGEYPVDASAVNLEIVSFAEQEKVVHNTRLTRSGSNWTMKPLKLNFPQGLYLGKIRALKGSDTLAATEFTLHIAPEGLAGKHPRLLFDAEKKKELDRKIRQPEFEKVFGDILKNARDQREKIPVNTLIFDLDQFPKEDWLPTWSAWGNKIYHTGEALRLNARAYAFHGDREAGDYVKQVLLKLASWPNWTHPWQTNRGRYSEHRTGSWAHRVAEAYDLTYDLMSADESREIRRAIMANIVDGAHRTYVVNDDITAATSNWLAMILGGSLMNMAAIYADGPDTENLEPYFTGALIKYYRFINRVVDQKDGAWGEGYGYNSYSFSNMAYSLPSLENVFNIDLTGPLVGSYNEFIWGSQIKNKLWFEYGDSGGPMGPATFWSFLLEKRREPRLSWFYNFMKNGETYEDVIFNTKNIPQDEPFDESPNKVFREVGTTVFKSGWENDDFIFAMRTGAFFNHQHLDQGTFWLADKGVIFIEERHLKNSTYYDDPIYQSKLIQPVAHSTILIDDNEQSQRTGDHLYHAPGFNDYAFIASYLEGRDAAFSSGNIGRLYYDKVKDLSRNVLFIKPRTVLMLDHAVPAEKDAKVSLLYQTAELAHIQPSNEVSKMNKQGVTLNFAHLWPKNVQAEAVETPHYLYTLQRERHLKKEGMLVVSSKTQNMQPLVMANLLSTAEGSNRSEVVTEEGQGFVAGQASGKKFAFNTKPGSPYETSGIRTDAVAITWSEGRDFVAMATNFAKADKSRSLMSDAPVTFEWTADSIRLSSEKGATVTIGAANRPSSIQINGSVIRNFSYDAATKMLRVQIPAGETTLKVSQR